MKNAIILHGSGETPNSFWIPYIKEDLEKKGYEVWIPQLPDADAPVLSKWLPLVLEGGKFSKETVIISHSAGGPLLLSVLEKIAVKIKQAILVAGFSYPLSGDTAKDILQDSYDWQKIKDNVEDIIFINSNNDPWGCDDKQGKLMFDNLGGTLIVRDGEGHMGSDKFNQPYREFPLLTKLID
jgi:hypothetical protein